MDYVNNADMITQIINQYTIIFSSYFSQFLNWGKWLFYSFSTIWIVWFCLWQAFDKSSLAEAMPDFIKEFFLIGFFYTVMINAAPWLSSLVDTAQSMSQQLTHKSIDPASIIQQGLTVANQILAPIKNSGAMSLSIGASLIIITYLMTLASFIAVALNLAVTLLMTTFLIALSSLFLALGSFAFTRTIAQRLINAVIAYSLKLLALYLTIGAGSEIFGQLANNLPKDQVTTFDVYAWTIAGALLFWLTTFCLSKQLASLFNDSIPINQQSNTSANQSVLPIDALRAPSIAEVKFPVSNPAQAVSVPLKILKSRG